MSEEFRGYFFVFLAGALWGTIGLFVKILAGLGSTATFTSFCRMSLAFLIMAAVTVAQEGFRSFLIDGRTLLYCALLGLICHAANNVLYSSAVTSIGMSYSAVLMYTAPIFTTIAARLFFTEKITTWKCLALLINITGCVLTVTGGSFSGTQLPLIGIGLGIGAGLCYSMVAILGRLAMRRGTPFVVSTYSYLFATIFLIVFTKPWQDMTGIISGQLLLMALAYALVPTVIAYILYYRGLESITESSKVPVVASVETIVAALIGLLIFKEQLGPANAVGIVLVLCSVVLMNIKFSRPKEVKVNRL